MFPRYKNTRITGVNNSRKRFRVDNFVVSLTRKRVRKIRD